MPNNTSAPSYVITLNQIKINVFKKQIKNINLRIDHRGTVTVSAPWTCSKPLLLNYLKSKENWIKKHLKTVHLHAETLLRTLDSESNQENRRLQSWHRAEMKALLPQLISKWEPIIGVRVNEWGIKIMKTRWGSCNTRKKRIWLNLILMQKPLICLEYVLVHEMVHLLEASHNQRFYALMSQFMPDWKQHKDTLTQNVASAPN